MITDVDGQNELVRSLRKQLEATEQELANQKWVFERFLESPSWRMTAPIRWVARQVRAMLGSGTTGDNHLVNQHHPGAPRHPSSAQEGNSSASLALKELLTAAYRSSLQVFLRDASRLILPRVENPKISIILVLYNRAELTFQCLRSITEQAFQDLEVIIIDNASTDETSQL